MTRWAWKTLLSQRALLVISAVSLAFTFVMATFFSAVFRGESERIVAYLENSAPDIWVMQSGVSNMHMANSFIFDWKEKKVAGVEGVEKVGSILYIGTVVNAGKTEPFSYFSFVVGLPPDATRGGPWAMAKGQAVPGQGEAVIPETVAKISGVTIGDEITVNDKSLKVVGLSKETYSMANPVTFIAFKDLEDILNISGSVSYLLVDVKEGADPGKVADSIMTDVDKVNVMLQKDFIESDFNIAMKMGVEIIAMMTAISVILAVLIVAFLSYTFVARKRRELAIAKAVGQPNRAVYIAVVFQGTCVTLLGFLLATVFIFTAFPLISSMTPQITLAVSAREVIQIGLIALAVSVVSSIVPAFMVTRLDPASVFYE